MTINTPMNIQYFTLQGIIMALATGQGRLYGPWDGVDYIQTSWDRRSSNGDPMSGSEIDFWYTTSNGREISLNFGYKNSSNNYAIRGYPVVKFVIAYK